MSTKTNMTPALATEKIISLLGEVKRDGIENLIKFMKESTYLTDAECYGHHKHKYGLMLHSLEVLDVMLRETGGLLPRESIILIALCHDLGKALMNGKKVGRGFHPYRSVHILQKCGVQLTDLEKEAISSHHPKTARHYAAYLTNPFVRFLSLADSRSTRINQRGEKYSYSML